MDKKLPWLVLLVALVLGLGFRLVGVGDPYLLDFHAWRQTDTAAFTHGYLTESFNPFDPSLDRFPCEHRNDPFGRAETELPVVAWVAALPLKALGIDYPSAPYLRGISVLFFVGTCAYLFFLAHRLTGSRTAAAASVLVFSVLPLSIFFTRTPQPDGPALLFACAFLFHLDRWLESEKVSEGALSALFGALVFLLKISNAFLFFPAIFLIVHRHGWLGSLRRWQNWVWGVAILVPVVAWYATVRRHPWTFGIWKDKYSSWEQFSELKIWQVLSERLTFEILTWGGIVLLVVGFATRGSSRAGRLAAVWLCAIFLFVAITLPANHTHIYYQLPLVLPASVMIALGADSLVRGGWLGRAVLAGALVVHAWSTWKVLPTYYRDEPGLEQAVEMLRAHVEPNSIVVSTTRDPRLFYNARIKGLFLQTNQLAALRACMGSHARFLVLENGVHASMQRSPALRANLADGFEHVDSGGGFTLLRRRDQTP